MLALMKPTSSQGQGCKGQARRGYPAAGAAPPEFLIHRGRAVPRPRQRPGQPPAELPELPRESANCTMSSLASSSKPTRNHLPGYTSYGPSLSEQIVPTPWHTSRTSRCTYDEHPGTAQDTAGRGGGSSGGRRQRHGPRAPPYDRNKFLAANFSFLVSDGARLDAATADADVPLDWEDVLQVSCCPPSCQPCDRRVMYPRRCSVQQPIMWQKCSWRSGRMADRTSGVIASAPP